MIAKVKPASAWACGFCGKLYPKNEHGKRFAEVCCVCVTEECGNATEYTGQGRMCSVCALKKTIASNEKYQADLEETLKRHRDELAKRIANQEKRK